MEKCQFDVRDLGEVAGKFESIMRLAEVIEGEARMLKGLMEAA